MAQLSLLMKSEDETVASVLVGLLKLEKPKAVNLLLSQTNLWLGAVKWEPFLRSFSCVQDQVILFSIGGVVLI